MLKFVKMHGLGNDFVIVDGFVEKNLGDLHTLAKQVCHRHFGIGADGLVILLPSTAADLKMRIFNSDGSEAEMCGNAIRCVAKYAVEVGLVHQDQIRVETLAGIIEPRLIEENGIVTGVTVDMGEPRLERSHIPMEGEGSPVIQEELLVDGNTFRVTCVSMGNPHCVIFVADLDKVKLKEIGPKIENHPIFPRKTNVEFVEIESQGQVKMRVWERGAGETMACGTGACATVVAAVLNGKTQRQVTVRLAGGDLFIEWSEEDNHVMMTGPATKVFTGEYPMK